MAYTVITATVTWTVIGRWAVTLSPVACRRVLAGTTVLLVAGKAGVTVLVDAADYFPLIWAFTALVVFFPAALLGSLDESVRTMGVGAAAASALLLLVIIYFVWLWVFSCWDRWASRPTRDRLVWWFSGGIALLGLALLVPMSGGCYMFNGHGEGIETRHVWLHCVIHLGMFVAAFVIIGLLQRHVRLATSAPPNWVKLVTLGYLCLYAVLLQVALFPINFYIP